MRIARSLLLMLLPACGAGCTTAGGFTYRGPDWKSERPLGRVMVFAPQYPAAAHAEQAAKDTKVRSAVRDALASVAGTTLVGSTAPTTQPVADSDAIAEAKKVRAQTVCILTVGEFYGSLIVPLVPPGWESRTHVTYAVRLLDVETGRVLLVSVRHRTTGGYLALTNPADYPSDLRADLRDVLIGSH